MVVYETNNLREYVYAMLTKAFLVWDFVFQITKQQTKPNKSKSLEDIQ